MPPMKQLLVIFAVALVAHAVANHASARNARVAQLLGNRAAA